ncbi:hypothetical protein LBMAG42_33360 [Deltaproteobacteria bacterium]|nr:hypothetical protein LBMAG42_33360 [Deltaproteobacteria bacterium]
MIGCLAVVFTVDRVEDEVVVLEVGAEIVEVAGLRGATEGARFVLCSIPPAAPVIPAASASVAIPPSAPALAPIAPST